MEIIIRNVGDVPIYEQIAAQVKQTILVGSLKEGEALPSIRLLAKELRVSVITTKRAYEELEREGFIVSVPGKGSFVAQVNHQRIREHHFKEIEDHLQKALNQARLCGLTVEDVVGMLKSINKGV